MTTKNLEQHAKHTASYRKRRKSGFKPVSKPWDWLTLAQVQKLAVEAYYVVSHAMSDLDSLPENPQQLFGVRLITAFDTFVADAALANGVVSAPAHVKQLAAEMRATVPPDWRPQYPIYQNPMNVEGCAL